MKNGGKTSLVLAVLAVVFGGLAAAFLTGLWGRSVSLPPIPLVDPSFLDTSTVRRSYADLVKARDEDALFNFDCYACHEKGNPPPLRYDAGQNLIIPPEHSDIVMGHGAHGRNNNCFNCHDENNLLRFQTKDGYELKFEDSTQLCGSCHGPTYRDWEGGAHGRTNGHWDRSRGPIDRKDCVNCHDPHSPKFPGRAPAPGPHPLRGHSPPSPTAEIFHDDGKMSDNVLQGRARPPAVAEAMAGCFVFARPPKPSVGSPLLLGEPWRRWPGAPACRAGSPDPANFPRAAGYGDPALQLPDCMSPAKITGDPNTTTV